MKDALKQENPLQVVGVINAMSAKLADLAGFKAIYLSGAGVANASFGLPDLGLTSLDNVLEDVRRIAGATEIPLLVDGDTGWGGELNVARAVQELIKAGAMGVHFEDQDWPKRCGHREGKKLIKTNEMQDKIKAAVDSKSNDKFTIMARTDALAVEGLDAAIERAVAYKEAGAEMIFAEAVTKLEDYQKFKDAVQIPILANITEFGKTDLFTKDELQKNGVELILYPLSAFRAMNQAALDVFKTIKNEGTQKSIVDKMQTRDELYKVLDYIKFESKIDK